MPGWGRGEAERPPRTGKRACRARHSPAAARTSTSWQQHARLAPLAQDFLNLYYSGLAVLLGQQDFYELADAYLARAAAEGVRHAEVFFDPQAHVGRCAGSQGPGVAAAGQQER